MNLKILVSCALIALVVWWITEQPSAAAHLVHNIGTFLSTAATGLSSFVANI